MQGRIADPYHARGLVERWGDQCVRRGLCLLSQNTEPRGEPLMAERDMSTFRMGVQWQWRCDSRHTCQMTHPWIQVVLFHFGTC